MMIRFAKISTGVLLFLSYSYCQAQQPPPQESSVRTYAESSEGLQAFLTDIIGAARSNDTAREMELIQSLIMPPHSTWFRDKFGPAYGPRLAAAYQNLESGLPDQIRVVFEADLHRGFVTPKIFRYADPESVNSPVDSFLNCMNDISPLYETAFNGDRSAIQLGPDPTAPGRMRQIAGDLRGYYVYVAGGFRYVPADVLMILPEQRPLRILLGMNVMKSKVTHRVQWVYPHQALIQHITGKVLVHLVLDTAGRIKDISLVEGPPVLADTVLQSLKHWTFEPTTLDGDPVEVEINFETNFQ